MDAKKRERLWSWLALAAILALGAFLRFYRLGADSIGNTYYAAAVKSMLTSWHNFFYVAFEPGGSVTVDKPPLGFWLQALSAAVFGLNGFALALPQALAGVFSIGVLYHLVQRRFGVWAGLLSALTLAVTPVAIATERNNTIDGLLVLVLLLAAWAFIKATESGQTRYLLLGALLVGIGFNIKMLQAIMPLPAFYALYLLGARRPWKTRLWQLLAASVLLITVSLSWALAVDTVSADARPYIGSTETNRVMELIIGHNGLDRLGLGQKKRSVLPGNAPQRPGQNAGAPASRPGGAPPAARTACENLSPGENCQVETPNGTQINGTCQNMPGGLACVPAAAASAPAAAGNALNPADDGQRRPRTNNETGEASLLRLFKEPLSEDAAWLLPLVLAGLFLALFSWGKIWPLQAEHLDLLLWGGWLLPSMAYFSFTTGLFHRYYLIMLAPPVAALTGITLVALSRWIKKQPKAGWLMAGILAAGTLYLQSTVTAAYPESPILTDIAVCLLLVAAISAWRRRSRLALTLGLIALLVAPAFWSWQAASTRRANVALPTANRTSTALPAAAPDNADLNDFQQKVLDYTLANTSPDAYLLATDNARNAAPFILHSDRKVLALGGFSGSDPIYTAEEFSQLVANGQVRYVLGLPQSQPEIAGWVLANCQIVLSDKQSNPQANNAVSILYACTP